MAKTKAEKAAPGLLAITQIRSGIRRPAKHRATLKALGLRHQRTVTQPDNGAIRGMIFQVRHLVEVREIADAGGEDEGKS